MSSLLYHLHPPTQVSELKGHIDVSPKVAVEHNMQMRALKGFDIPAQKDFVQSRVPVLTNNDVTLHLAKPQQSNTIPISIKMWMLMKSYSFIMEKANLKHN